MPIYCYKCFDCNHYEEIKQNFDDEPLTVCPKCKGNFKRVIRNIGVIFKGSGFHINDYKGCSKSALSSCCSSSSADNKDKSSKNENKKSDLPKTDKNK